MCLEYLMQIINSKKRYSRMRSSEAQTTRHGEPQPFGIHARSFSERI